MKASRGKLYLISAGPGDLSLVPPRVEAAMREVEVVVSYELYLAPMREWLAGKELITLPLGAEKERAEAALKEARAGRKVALVSSGDIGVYGMASLAFEMLREEDDFEVELVPGITAATSAAAHLGAPLSHDFATLSLSDLLCPWDWIERRAHAVAGAGYVVALYNVQSRTRREGVQKILSIFAEYRSDKTVCGVVRNAYRADSQTDICTLAELRERDFDMLTTVIIGNEHTQRRGRWMFTPRGYLGWQKCEASGGGENCAKEVKLPQGAVWIFSGTRDGNQLAQEVKKSGFKGVVSVATEYGREAAELSLGAEGENWAVVSGSVGRAERGRMLCDSGACAVVDATHPHAAQISSQLMELCKEQGIPYLRYERASASAGANAVEVCDAKEAGKAAAVSGKRLFLACGVKGLAEMMQALKGSAVEACFARVMPDEESVRRAVEAGVPRGNICAMQGPFSVELNVALWKQWGIDCVVTKESGAAGAFPEKVEAARQVGAKLIVIRRPELSYPEKFETFESLLHALQQHCATDSASKEIVL